MEPIASLAVHNDMIFLAINSCDEAHCVGGLQNVRRGLSETFEPISGEWVSWLPRDLFLTGNLAYVAAGSVLHVIYIAEGGVLNDIGQFNSTGYGGDLASDGPNVYMLDYHMNVVNAFDLSMPQQPVWRQQFFSSHYLTDIAVGGGYFYLAVVSRESAQHARFVPVAFGADSEPLVVLRNSQYARFYLPSKAYRFFARAG